MGFLLETFFHDITETLLGSTLKQDVKEKEVNQGFTSFRKPVGASNRVDLTGPLSREDVFGLYKGFLIMLGLDRFFPK